MTADNEDDEDASGESNRVTENENADTDALQKQKEKEQKTPDENIEEAQRPRRTTRTPSYVRGSDLYCWWEEMLCCVMLIRSGCSRKKSPLGVWDFG